MSEVTRDPLMNQIIDQFVTAYPSKIFWSILLLCFQNEYNIYLYTLAEQRSLEQRNEWDEKELLHLETYRRQRDYEDEEEDSYDSGSEVDGENEGQEEDSFNTYEDFDDDRDEAQGSVLWWNINLPLELTPY